MKNQQNKVKWIWIISIILLISLGFVTNYASQPRSIYVDIEDMGVLEIKQYDMDNPWVKIKMFFKELPFAIYATPNQPQVGEDFTITIDYTIPAYVFLDTAKVQVRSGIDLYKSENFIDLIPSDCNFALGCSARAEISMVAPPIPNDYTLLYVILDTAGDTVIREESNFKVVSSGNQECAESYYTDYIQVQDDSTKQVYERAYMESKFIDFTCKFDKQTEFKTKCKDGYEIVGEDGSKTYVGSSIRTCQEIESEEDDDDNDDTNADDNDVSDNETNPNIDNEDNTSITNVSNTNITDITDLDDDSDDVIIDPIIEDDFALIDWLKHNVLWVSIISGLGIFSVIAFDLPKKFKKVIKKW